MLLFLLSRVRIKKWVEWKWNRKYMFNKIISWSLENKITVLVIAGILTAAGLWSIATMKVDILPDINKPTVTIFAESPGMAVGG